MDFIYLEKSKIRIEGGAVISEADEQVATIDMNRYNTLMLGPGTSISHAAIASIAKSGKSIAWVGQNSSRLYASASMNSKCPKNTQLHATRWSRETSRVAVARRMYQYRFLSKAKPVRSASRIAKSLRTLRGQEGTRMRRLYEEEARRTGVPWTRRTVDGAWADLDPINRAISTGNSCLYGLCHTVISTNGFSPALGFIHSGNARSFVFDIADLYKAEITIPIAFDCTKESPEGVESRVLHSCFKAFGGAKFNRRVLLDIEALLRK